LIILIVAGDTIPARIVGQLPAQSTRLMADMLTRPNGQALK
jgi:hypothetical protein